MAAEARIVFRTSISVVTRAFYRDKNTALARDAAAGGAWIVVYTIYGRAYAGSGNASVIASAGISIRASTGRCAVETAKLRITRIVGTRVAIVTTD